ncbi:g3740 [Coccomyxa viridis]|uniref:U6 snRNA-associated Sm-like protein LSm1 n=1 Tax=Coccomyxa viridis TaxID=1274662 RepID=A0ABP1FVP4_9CHLO
MNLDDRVPPPGAALVEDLDKRLLVQLRDGRKLIGTLRSFDQFANLVLEGAVERIVVGNLYAEDPLGLYVVRGENVVLLGDIDGADDPPAVLQKVSIQDIRQAQRAEKEQEKIKKSMKARMDFLDFE